MSGVTQRNPSNIVASVVKKYWHGMRPSVRYYSRTGLARLTYNCHTGMIGTKLSKEARK